MKTRSYLSVELMRRVENPYRALGKRRKEIKEFDFGLCKNTIIGEYKFHLRRLPVRISTLLEKLNIQIISLTIC